MPGGWKCCKAVSNSRDNIPTTTFIHLADSEADICELFCETATFPENYHLIVRGCHTRNIVAAVDSVGSQAIEAATVGEALNQAQPRVTRTIAIGKRDASPLPDDQRRARKQPREPRHAVLTIRAVTRDDRWPQTSGRWVVARRDHQRRRSFEKKTLLKATTAVHWFLFTTLPIASDDEVEAVVTGYRQRWPVETLLQNTQERIEDRGR